MSEYKTFLNGLINKMAHKIACEGYPVKEAYYAIILEELEANNTFFNRMEQDQIFLRGGIKGASLIKERSDSLNYDWELNPEVELLDTSKRKSNSLKYRMLEYARLIKYENKDKNIIFNKLVNRFDIDLSDANSLPFKLLAITMEKI